MIRRAALLALLATAAAAPVAAQGRSQPVAISTPTEGFAVDFQHLRYRNVGPARGGASLPSPASPASPIPSIWAPPAVASGAPPTPARPG